MTDVSNPLNIRNIRFIVGGPGGDKMSNMFRKQALQMLKQGHLANAPLPQWRMRRYVSDDKGNIILINIKSCFGLDTIEFIAPPELPVMERQERGEIRRKQEVPGGRREFFPAIRVWDEDGTQIGFIVGREESTFGPPWDVIELPKEHGLYKTEAEAGFVDWREGQWSRLDSPYQGRGSPYPRPEEEWATAIDISIPDVKDELWLWRDVPPAHDEMFLEPNWEAIDPVHVNRPPLPGYKKDWTGNYYYHYHAGGPSTHVYVSGLKPSVHSWGNWIYTAIALHDRTSLFKERSAWLHNYGTALQCNFQIFTINEAWEEDIEQHDGYTWAFAHNPVDPDPDATYPFMPTNIGWWNELNPNYPFRMGTVAAHDIIYTHLGTHMYWVDYYGTWSSKGYATLYVDQHVSWIAHGERKWLPAGDVIDNWPWETISVLADNPCLQVYPNTCGWWGRAQLLDAEITELEDRYSWEEFFEVNGKLYPIKSGTLTPPSEYGSYPGIRAQQTHPRYFVLSDDNNCAILGLKRHLFHTFEYYFYGVDEKKGTVDISSVEFDGYVYKPVSGEDSFMHLVTGEVFLHGKQYPGTLYGNGTTRLFEKMVLEMSYEEQVIRFDSAGAPEFSTTPGH